MRDAIAGNRICPCRFLTEYDGRVIQASAGEPICGVMERYQKYPVVDSEAATRGDSLRYYEHGEIANLELATDCAPGDFLGSDDEGRGVSRLKLNDYYGGYAHQSGKAGDIIQIFVQCGQVGELIARQGPL